MATNNEYGFFRDIQLTEYGELRINDIGLSYAKNINPNIKTKFVFGYNDDIDTGTVPEEVWTVGGVYPFQSTASILDVVSTSTSDSFINQGAKQIMIEGLDANYDEISEIVNMAGTIPSSTTNEFLRVNRAFVLSAGTSKGNVGDIDIQVTGGGDILARINSFYGVTQKCQYTVPSGYTAYIKKGYFSGSRGGSIGQIFVRVKSFNPVLNSWNNAMFFNVETDTFQFNFDIPLPLQEKTDFTVQVDQVQNNNTTASCGYELLLVKN